MSLLGRTSISNGYPVKNGAGSADGQLQPVERDSVQAAVDPFEAWQAALDGYFVPDDGDGEDDAGGTKKEQEAAPLELLGDAEKLSPKQKQVLLMLKETRQYSRMKLKQVNLSFSGASVYFFTPFRQDGTPMPSSVLKFDTEECVKDELVKTKKYAKLFGITTPKVKDAQYLPNADPNEPASVMQIDLCGGIFGLPEFASAPPVQTFASVLENELEAKERKVDVMPIINEALERRMYFFTMSSRSVRTVNLAKTYKLVRFVGHGILNRAKEGAKRGAKSPALAAGFENPRDVDDLDPDGSFMEELCGRRMPAKEYFQNFVSQEQLLEQKFERELVTGFCHNDLHGGNLLLDSQGLVWLIDFATVKDNVHVLMDLVKFMSACLFMYLNDNVNEEHVRMFGKLLFTTPDATTAFPVSAGEQLEGDQTAQFVVSLLSRLRHCMCIYENGDDAPDNDGVPFAVALFSWATRMLSYSEPSLHQKGRALYFAIAGAQRLLWEAGVDVGPTACSWIEDFRLIWEGQKGRRLSTSATSGPQLAFYEFGVEFPRYLSQVGASEAWSTDFLTREKVHVTEHAIAVSIKFAGRIQPRFVSLPHQTKVLLQKLSGVFNDYLPELLQMDLFYGRILIIGDSGTGKSMLTKQLFSEVAQRQVSELRAQEPGSETSEEAEVSAAKSGIVPVRVPLIDLSRQLEAEPHTSLEADPVSDLLTEWVKRKHGQDSVPHQLISDVRNACVGELLVGNRRSSVRSSRRSQGSAFEVEVVPRVLKEPSNRNSIISTDQGENEAVTGLLLLLDGLDEASTRRMALLEYMKSLLNTEPIHVPLVTSRPGSLGPVELDVFASLGFNSFSMSQLTEEQAKQIAQRTLTRMGDPEEAINSILQQISDPGYSTLIGNPLVLTLLIHVLRKGWTDAKRKAEAEGVTHVSSAAQRADVLKKTDIYQRSVKLMLHQSDAAKFMLRDGASDLAMVQRLEQLKSARARKFFQGVSWHAHCQRARSLSWDAMSEACQDADIFKVFKDTFEEGRMPIFEAVETSGNEEAKLQMTHLSFQELMTGEYSSAIVRHSHAKQKARSYINFFSSNSTKTLSRDRLAEQWWLQVWFHICEMLHEDAFNEWCDILAEDKRAHVQIGTLTHRKIFDPIVSSVEGDESKSMYPWIGGWAMQVKSVDWVNHRVWVKPVLSSCLRKARMGHYNKLLKDDIELMEVQWRADGVATIFRQAARQNDVGVLTRLLNAGVHYGLVDDDGINPLLCAIQNKHWDALKLFVDHKADYCAHNTIVSPQQHNEARGYKEPILREIYKLSDVMYELGSTRPHGVLKEAYEGTLAVVPELDVNFVDPSSGMTPLMYAAAGGHPKLVDALLRMQASVTAESAEGATALSFACECARGTPGIECVRLLLGAKSNPNQKAGKTYNGRFIFEFLGRGTPCSHVPCGLGEDEKLELLLEAGMDPNDRNDFGFTAAWKVMESANVEGMKRMKECNADFVNAELGFKTPYSSRGFANELAYGVINPTWKPINWHCFRNPDLEVLKFLLDLKIDVHTSFTSMGFNFSCILHMYWMDPAIHQEEDLSKLELFLDRKFDLNAQAQWIGMTHMSMAAATCFSQATLLLFFSRKGDTGKPKGVMTQDFLSTAKSTKNVVAVNTYNDWMMMQQGADA
eukprot:TRINITY_DN3514_c0_g1_i3.p1 TRINITY_DN3514_c0_g1~~TRINITY_DN3514_c0_g1_i3.p1  ORF type:complete len:1714 (+),score=420.18 TRINITY_DN3514_c0_g1_i3:199-5142(+)